MTTKPDTERARELARRLHEASEGRDSRSIGVEQQTVEVLRALADEVERRGEELVRRKDTIKEYERREAERWIQLLEAAEKLLDKCPLSGKLADRLRDAIAKCREVVK